MSTPQLNRQLQTQLSQWIKPKDKRHLTVHARSLSNLPMIWGHTLLPVVDYFMIRMIYILDKSI